MKRLAQIVAAIVLILLGGLWAFQGAGWVGGSFMSGDRIWLVIGVVLVAAGLMMLVQALRRRS